RAAPAEGQSPEVRQGVRSRARGERRPCRRLRSRRHRHSEPGQGELRPEGGGQAVRAPAVRHRRPQGRHGVHHLGERGAPEDARGRDVRPAVEEVLRRRGAVPREALTAYRFDWSAVARGLPYLLEGAGLTVLISSVAMVLAGLLGLVLAAISQAPGRAARRAVATYVEVFRNTPLLIQIFIVYFGLPQLGLTLSPFLSGLSALVLYAAA